MLCILVHEGHQKRAAAIAGVSTDDAVAIDSILLIALKKGLEQMEWDATEKRPGA